MPEPYRYPTHHRPTVLFHGPWPRVEVGFPNEEPETEDDRVLQFLFTEEGVIVDAYVSEENIATFALTYEETYDRLLGGA